MTYRHRLADARQGEQCLFRAIYLTENIFGLKTAVNHMEKLDSIRHWAFLERIHFRNPW